MFPRFGSGGSGSGGARLLDVAEAEAAVVELGGDGRLAGGERRRHQRLETVEVDADAERPHLRHDGAAALRQRDAAEGVAAQPVLKDFFF